jgi:dephospho-CoA kinase
LKKRGRSDDPRNVSEFRERDKRELRLGIGKVMDTADKRIKNEADAITFRSQVREALEEMSRVG